MHSSIPKCTLEFVSNNTSNKIKKRANVLQMFLFAPFRNKIFIMSKLGVMLATIKSLCPFEFLASTSAPESMKNLTYSKFSDVTA